MAKISVFMPCYNGGKYLGRAIESICNQTFSDFELIIVNDGSIDNSREIMNKWEQKDDRIRIIDNGRNRGVAYTRNLGLQECKGKYIALMDADDIAPQYRLALENEYLDTHPYVDAVSGAYIIIEEGTEHCYGGEIRKLSYLEVKARLLFSNVVANGSVMYRKNILDNYKLRYQEDYAALEDYRFWCEFIKFGNITVIPEILQYYRIVNTGLSRNTTMNKPELMDCLFDKIHMDYLEQLGIVLDQKNKDVYLKITRESGRVKSLYDWLMIGKMLLEIYKKSRSLDCRRELKKYMVSFWWQNRCLNF